MHTEHIPDEDIGHPNLNEAEYQDNRVASFDLSDQETIVTRQEAVRRLEEMEVLPDTKAELALAALDMKPAAWIDFRTQDVDNAVAIARGLGLQGTIAPSSAGLWALSVGKTPEAVERLNRAVAAQDNRAIGASLGYPKTAVDAFIEGNGMTAGPLIEHYTGESDPTVLAIARFAISPDHAQEEIAVARQWAKALQEFSPTIYDQIDDADYAERVRQRPITDATSAYLPQYNDDDILF